MPIIFRSGTDIKADKELYNEVVAVDLGFANAKKSCGLAWSQNGTVQSESLDFGSCVDKVIQIIKEHKKIILIIEAPLSSRFNDKGNPMSRGGFESKSSNHNIKTSRYWYTGAGASICLGAAFFLKRISDKALNLAKQEDTHEVVLYEGFITFKDENAKKLTHAQDAEALVECFEGKRKCCSKSVNGDGVIVLSDVIALTTSSPAPHIIVSEKP